MLSALKIKYNKLFFREVTNNHLRLKKEEDEGYVEYKRSLVDCDKIAIEKYATQMQWRINQNPKGKFAIYYVGVDDDGTIYGLSVDDIINSIDTIVKIASIVNASITYVNITSVNYKIIIKFGVKIKSVKENYLVDI